MLATAQERCIEIKGDRTVLYPQQMELNGEETLLDLLLTYPEMLIGGFNDLLNNMEPEKSGVSNSGYELRMNNVAIAGDLRIVLSTIKVKEVKKVQILDNPGVARGAGGLKGIIDVNLLNAQEGTKGSVEVQVGNDGIVAPIANVIHSSKKNDLYLIASYDKPANEQDKAASNTYMFAELTSRITHKDKLLSYFSLQNSSLEAARIQNISQSDGKNIMARFRWFHTFNDKGTELQGLLGYQYSATPTSAMNKSMYRHKETKTNVPMMQLELNTPLFTKDLTMLLGWECDMNFYDLALNQTMESAESRFNRSSKYNVTNNDLYLQFNYVFDKFVFTIGDRIQFYHYNMNSPVAGKWSRNTIRNMWQASIVATPSKEHQLQLAYNRKAIHPSYTAVIPEALPTSSGYYTIGNAKLNEAIADVFKFAYGYTTKPFSAQVGVSFIHAGNYFSAYSVTNSVYSWRNKGQTDTWKAEASASYRSNNLSITAGANYYTSKIKGTADPINFVTGRLNGDYTYLKDWHLSGMLMLSTSQSPIRQAHNNCLAYGQLMLSKYFGSNIKAAVQWHDIFEKQRSALLGSISYIF